MCDDLRIRKNGRYICCAICGGLSGRRNVLEWIIVSILTLVLALPFYLHWEVKRWKRERMMEYRILGKDHVSLED